MILALRRSTLFPYTTLFRSNKVGRSVSMAYDEEQRYGNYTINGGMAERDRKEALLHATVDGIVAVALLFVVRSEEHTSELQSPYDLVCRLLLEKKKKK